MTLEEYLRDHRARYAEFATTVRSILDAALRARADLARPQHKQDRAKDEASLRRKLEERGRLASTTIETEIKDLAGCRLVFYTNTDADRFLQSRIILDNFEIDQDNTRIHYPVGEDVPPAKLYRARHYVVSLKPDRLALAEYSRFASMRCEIQIQTTLNHAWSETGHDILYKRPFAPGFGAKQLEAIDRRFAKIMEDYLLPAGYEFQKIKHDYERLMEGKALFDRGVIEELGAANDNNQRWDLLKRIREHVVPHYDDIAGVYPELLRALVKAIRDGRTTPVKAIETDFGNFRGHTSNEVADAALDIVDFLRFVDVDATFEALRTIASMAADERESKRIDESVERLSKNNLRAWRKLGPRIQTALVSRVSAFEPDERKLLFQLIVSVCRHALEPDVTGTSAGLNSVTFHNGAVVVSKALVATRKKALSILQTLYAEAEDDERRGVVLNAMLAATRTPSTADYGDDLLNVTLADTSSIIQFFTERFAVESFEMLQHLEHTFWRMHRRNRTMPAEASPALARDIDALNTAIIRFRDIVNAREDFVVHKTLVGFESVFPIHWQQENANYREREAYRTHAIEGFVADITDANADQWLQIIKRCASTKSNDLATFPSFINFLKRLSVVKSEVALRYLRAAPEELMNFLPAFLEGLDESAAQPEVRTLVREWIAQGRYLRQIARRFRLAREVKAEDIRALSKRTLAAEDIVAVIETTVAVVARAELAGSALVDDVYIPSLRFLSDRKDARWLNDAWFQRASETFFAALTAAQTQVTLDNMVFWPDVSWHVEEILGAIAVNHHDLVWQFFRKRLAYEPHAEGPHYKAIPYEFHKPAASLSSNPERAVDIVRGWNEADDPLFRFHGGQLLAIAFPTVPDRFEAKLLSLLEAEGEAAFSFVAIMENYEGEPFTYRICQALIDAVPENDDRLGAVEVALLSTGVVSGEFGFVEAYQAKKAVVGPWLKDHRPKVRAFAEEYSRMLDNRIASEQQQAEERLAMRRLDFEGDEGARGMPTCLARDNVE
jgi:ppGpp synthetase/RelA/SpoT-type nucleotidyltranferase